MLVKVEIFKSDNAFFYCRSGMMPLLQKKEAFNPYQVLTTGHFLLDFGHALLQATLKPL